MKKFVKNILIFSILPLIVICVLEVVLPETTFTFRVKEAISFSNEWIPHRGPFYPNRKVLMVSKGDLCPHSVDAISKKGKLPRFCSLPTFQTVI